ncbi:sigma non-opioid intracellular receptor 1-like [Lineus longissimus]|uniref:sigma non-opioid intracellular receptor 1-like n=1 Tax=Lineus longissimus TaxID=88925 RepID=UPI002B4F5EE2
MLRTVFKLAFYGAILCLLIHSWLTYKDYLFDQDEIHAMAKKYVGKDPAVAYKLILKELRQKFPGHILPNSDLQWIFVNAGGWMGSMCLLHASLTEYVLFFGTAVDTSGHSGRYWANISDTVLTGEFRQWKEGEIKSTVHKPGDTIVHVWGEATAVQFSAGTWFFEYGRGFIPSTMGFALADTLFSTQDFVTMYYTFRIYTKGILQELSHNVFEYIDFMKGS